MGEEAAHAAARHASLADLSGARGERQCVLHAVGEVDGCVRRVCGSARAVSARHRQVFQGYAKARLGSLSLDSYLELAHLLVTTRSDGAGMIDALLAARQLTRRVALRIPHFYSALAIVARSDLVLTAPASLARLPPGPSAVTALAPPLDVPGHAVQLVWHERFSSDPGHTWLRDLLTETSRATVHP